MLLAGKSCLAIPGGWRLCHQPVAWLKDLSERELFGRTTTILLSCRWYPSSLSTGSYVGRMRSVAGLGRRAISLKGV